MGNSRYQFEHTRTNSDTFNLIYVSHSKYEDDWPSLLHTHPFTELFYITSGRGALMIENEKHPIQKNDFIIVNANTTHAEISSPSEPLEYITIGVENLLFSFKKEMGYIIFNCNKVHDDLMFYMTTMLHEMVNKATNYEQVCQNLLDVLIIQLMRRNNFNFEIEPSILLNRECLKIKRYLDANYMKDITLDNLASLFHLNKYYMSHAFTKYCGCSPISYLCQTRIQASKELLINTSYSITEIAYSTGFSSQSYFAQCFQKTCGITASAYRRIHKKKKQSTV